MDSQKVRDMTIAGVLLVILALSAVAALKKPAGCSCPPSCPNCCPCPKETGYGQLTPQTRFTSVRIVEDEATLTWQDDAGRHTRTLPVAQLEALCLAAEASD